MKVFLGGTWNDSIWRDVLIKYLKIDYFNPIVKDWTPECQAEEIKQRQDCEFVVYVITPKMTGVYSIAEVVDDSNKRPNSTILVLLKQEFDSVFSESQFKSLISVGKMVNNNGSTVFIYEDDYIDKNMAAVAKYLNSGVLEIS